MSRRNKRRLKSRRRYTRRNKRIYRGGNSDETNAIYVSSRGLMKSCDVKPKDVTSSNHNVDIEISLIKDGTVVYLHTTAIRQFIDIIPRIQAKFILVSGDSDLSIPGDHLSEDNFNKFIENDNIIHWFSQNAVKDHPKLTKIPIGVDYHTDTTAPVEQEKQLIAIKNSGKPLLNRKAMCYANFKFENRRKYAEREDAINKVPNDLVFYESSRISREDTWKHQIEYAFVISPPGNGLDCHRTWEALSLGCIPIVKSSPIDSLFNDLPVLIVAKWEDLTKELLENTVKDYSTKNFNMDKLTLKYWMDLIRSKK